MKKVSPMQEKTLDESKRTYNDLFSNVTYYIDTKLKARGIHDLIAHVFKENLKKAKVLDIGCGYGRFSFIASALADKVVGVDMTESAISVANHIKSSFDIDNVDFVCSSIEEYEPQDKFDFILLSGTLEHIHEASPILEKINGFLANNGLFITDSPSEFNFRGIFHASLWKLFNFPMTLSDVRIVTPQYMERLAKDTGFEVERIVGTLYKRGWGDAGAIDLKTRMRNVLSDVSGITKDINVSFESYDNWVDEANHEFNLLLDAWLSGGILKKIPERDSFEYNLNKDYLNSVGLPADKIEEYMMPDYSIDPFYCDVEPYNRYGGNNIYILKNSS